MGILGLFKKAAPQEEPSKKISEKEILDNLADFHERRGDRMEAFHFRNKAVIDLYDKEISNCLVLARESKEYHRAVQYYLEALSEYDSFRDWCSSQPDGEAFFIKHDSRGPENISFYSSIVKEKEKLEYKNAVVIPTILEKATHGVLQSELIKSFDMNQDEIRAIIKRLEEDGKIRKEKSGKSYMIYAP